MWKKLKYIVLYIVLVIVPTKTISQDQVQSVGSIIVGSEYTTGNTLQKGEYMSWAPIIKFFALVPSVPWLQFYGHGKFFIDTQSQSYDGKLNPNFGNFKHVEIVLGVNLTQYVTIELNEHRSMDIIARYIRRIPPPLGGTVVQNVGIEINYAPFITGNWWNQDDLARGHLDDLGIRFIYRIEPAPWINLGFATKAWIYNAAIQDVAYPPVWGWNTVSDKNLGYWIDRKANESRMGIIWAIIISENNRKKVPLKAFQKMEVYAMNYTIDDKKYVPILTWDGGLFQLLMPANTYKTFKDHLTYQYSYANKNNIPVLSSAAATIDGKYSSHGVPELSESFVKFNNKHDVFYTGTPHATALSYMVDKKKSVDMLISLQNKYPKVVGKYGYYDAIDNKGNVATRYLSLDHGMFVTSFLSESIQEDVKTYLKSIDSWDTLEKIYKSFK